MGASRLLLRGFAVFYAGGLVAAPVGVLLWRALAPGVAPFWAAICDPAAVSAFEHSALIASISTAIDVIFGVGTALLLARYAFPGKRVLDAIIDVPVAASPIVVGLALVLVYGVGGWFSLGQGQVIGATLGMVLATVFVSLPLVVRSVLPVLEEVGTDQEQAAASLGAHAWTIFWRITLPGIRVALGYGLVLSFARCLGEFGAVLVVSGGFQSTRTAPLLVATLFESDFAPDQAYAIALVLALVAVLAMVIVSLLQKPRRSS